MENVRVRNLPLAGMIQHGEQQVVGTTKKVRELGYFIAKVTNPHIEYLSNRFEEKHPQEKKLKVRFIDEDPFSIRNTRYSLNKTACYCMENSTQAKQKISNKWETVECSSECEHRKIKEGSNKPNCNREGRLFFMLPEISSDRMWYMLIRGQTSIDRIRDYIKFQKEVGNSLKGDFVIYLTQEPQTNKSGKTFNNYILGIYKEELDSNQTIPKNENNKEKVVKAPVERVVEDKKETIVKEVKKQETSNLKEKQVAPKETTKPKIQTSEKVEDIKKKQPTEKSKEKPKQIKSKAEDKSKEKEDKVEQIMIGDKEVSIDKIYTLITTTRKSIKNAKGESKEYLIGNFVNSNDKQIDVIIPPKHIEELENCNIGTLVEMEIKKAGDKTYTDSLNFIQKYIKNVAA